MVALHPLIGEALIHKRPESAAGGLAGHPLRPAGHGHAGDEGVDKEKDRERPGEGPAGPVGDFQDVLGHPGIEILDPEDAQHAPEYGVHQADAPVEVQRHAAVVPGPGAQQGLLGPGADVLQYAAHHEAAQKGPLVAPVAVLVECQGQADGARTVEQVEGPVDQPGPALKIAVGDEAPEHLHHNAGKAARGADEQDLVDVEPLGEVVPSGLRQIDGGVGRRVGDVPLPLPGGAHVPQAGAQLVCGAVQGLIGLDQGPGDLPHPLQLRLDLRLQCQGFGPEPGGGVLRLHGRLGQGDIVALLQGLPRPLRRRRQRGAQRLQLRGNLGLLFFHFGYLLGIIITV